MVRAKLADWHCKRSKLRYTGYRSLSALSRGKTPGLGNSIGKLVAAPMTQDVASFVMDLMEMSGAVRDEDYSPDAGLFQSMFMAIRGFRIVGGTDEIMANIITESMPGLPKEPRLDKAYRSTKCPPAPARAASPTNRRTHRDP